MSPMVLGHEGAGVVEAMGADVRRFAVDDYGSGAAKFLRARGNVPVP